MVPVFAHLEVAVYKSLVLDHFDVAGVFIVWAIACAWAGHDTTYCFKSNSQTAYMYYILSKTSIQATWRQPISLHVEGILWLQTQHLC